MTAAAVISLLALCLCVFLVHGDVSKDECVVKGKGRVLTFGGRKLNMKLPCKYQATTMICGKDYKINVTPGQAFDHNARYFTDSLWVSVEKVGTPFFWAGRTSTKRVARYFNDTDAKTAFSTKRENMAGAPFAIKMLHDKDENSVTLTVSDSAMKIKFNAYDRDYQRRKDNAGVVIYCPTPTYLAQSDFPKSICGNSTDQTALRNRRKELKFGSKTRAVIYDMLNAALVKQTDPVCETAVREFDTCQADRNEVVKQCGNILTNNKLIKCLDKHNFHPMTVFVHCLKYKCNSDLDACDLLSEALDGCPKIAALPKNKCPLGP